MNSDVEYVRIDEGTAGLHVAAARYGQGSAKQTIGVWSLFIIIFSNVGSAPASVEDVVGTSSILFAIIGISVFPFFFSYIQAAINTELALRYKHVNGGLSAFALQQNNKTLAFNATLWLFLVETSTSSFVSQASVAYMTTVFPAVDTYRNRVLVSMGIILLSFSFNAIDIKFVSRSFWVFSVFTVTVFAILIGLSFKNLDWNRANELRSTQSSLQTLNQVQWAEYININLFNAAGIDLSGSVVSYIETPHRTIPIAIVLTSVIVTVFYAACFLFPYLATYDDKSAWKAGYFSYAAKTIGGTPLQISIIIACVLVNIQIFIVCIQTASYTLASMAECGVIPRLFAKRTSRGSPINALCACVIFSFIFAVLPYKMNLAIEAVLYALIMLALVYCSLLVNTSEPTLFMPQRFIYRLFYVLTATFLSLWTIILQEQYTLLAILCVLGTLALGSLGLDSSKWSPPDLSNKDEQRRVPHGVDSKGQAHPLREAKAQDLINIATRRRIKM